MDIGLFSISLAVKDLAASRDFYQTLGFTIADGSLEDQWLMLHNGHAKIGLFQGMFDDNLITFNPPDVRGLQQSLKAAGYTFDSEADEDGAGPAHAALKDPDGNIVLLDQF